MEPVTLRETVRFLEAQLGAHISICDFGGLSSEVHELPFVHQIHSIGFCSAAKSTARGLERCLRCKAHANHWAKLGEPFEGLCAWGLYEFACPVCRDGQVLGVVYAGGLIPEPGTPEHALAVQSVQRRTRGCARTGVSVKLLDARAADCPPLGDRSDALRTAVKLMAELLRLRTELHPRASVHSATHPAVQTLLQYAQFCWAQQLSLAQLARLCHMDAKYLGRLFARETGQHFHEYLNAVRLVRAAELLIRGSSPVLEIALACGFPNISYFNRLFRARYGCTPRAYRIAGEDVQEVSAQK